MMDHGSIRMTIRKFNGVLSYSRGDATNGFTITGMRLPWNLEFDGPDTTARGR